MSKGKVREYDSNRGCGSIVDSATGQHLIVYANYVNLKDGQALNTGQEVTFDIENKRSENWAINVQFS